MTDKIIDRFVVRQFELLWCWRRLSAGGVWLLEKPFSTTWRNVSVSYVVLELNQSVSFLSRIKFILFLYKIDVLGIKLNADVESVDHSERAYRIACRFFSLLWRC
jgi:hypothetical protein